MSEGSFVILTPISQQQNIERVIVFLNENGIENVSQKRINEKYIELFAESLVEFEPDNFINLCQSLTGVDDWYRVFEEDEYGTEVFWLIEKETRWRICTDQSEPDVKTLHAYRKWHDGLDMLRYGAIQEEELVELEEKFGIFDKNGNPIAEPSPSLKEQLGEGIEFIGKGITVPHAGKYWNWMIPDLECYAVRIARDGEFPSDDGYIRYVRSYMIQGDVGFVWSWTSGGYETLLLFIFSGEYCTWQCIVRSNGRFTIDEAILIPYFEVEKRFNEADEYFAYPDLSKFGNDALDAMENVDPFESGFDGRVVSPYHAALYRRDGKYCMTEHLNSDASPIDVLDAELDNKLKTYASEIYDKFVQGVYCRPKLRLNSDGQVTEFIAGRFIGIDESGDEVTLAEIPLKFQPVSVL